MAEIQYTSKPAEVGLKFYCPDCERNAIISLADVNILLGGLRFKCAFCETVFRLEIMGL